jgi:hypothetical protein
MISGELTLSPSAAQRIHAIGKSEGKALMLRVAVEGGGAGIALIRGWSEIERYDRRGGRNRVVFRLKS